MDDLNIRSIDLSKADRDLLVMALRSAPVTGNMEAVAKMLDRMMNLMNRIQSETVQKHEEVPMRKKKSDVHSI